MQAIRTELVKKYAPKSIDDFIFSSDSQEKIIRNWLAKPENTPTRLAFQGGPGTGKSTICKLLIENLGIEYAGPDCMVINSAKETGIDFIRYKVQGFIETMSWGINGKAVVFEEYDGISNEGQNALKVVIEHEHYTNVMFYMTTNKNGAIHSPMTSRCPLYTFTKPDANKTKARLEYILKSEGVKYTDIVLMSYMDSHYPDIRACINNIAYNIIENELYPMSDIIGNAYRGIQFDEKEVDIQFLRQLTFKTGNELSQIKEELDGIVIKKANALKRLIKNGDNNCPLYEISNDAFKMALKRRTTLKTILRIM